MEKNATHLLKDGYFHLDAAVRIVARAVAEGRALTDAERVAAIREKTAAIPLLRKSERLTQRFMHAGVNIDKRALPEPEFDIDPTGLKDRMDTLSRTAARVRATAIAEQRDLNAAEVKDLSGLSDKIDDLQRTIAIVEQLQPFYE
jgi:hypothetical protein